MVDVRVVCPRVQVASDVRDRLLAGDPLPLFVAEANGALVLVPGEAEGALVVVLSVEGRAALAGGATALCLRVDASGSPALIPEAAADLIIRGPRPG